MRIGRAEIKLGAEPVIMLGTPHMSCRFTPTRLDPPTWQFFIFLPFLFEFVYAIHLCSDSSVLVRGVRTTPLPVSIFTVLDRMPGRTRYSKTYRSIAVPRMCLRDVYIDTIDQ